MAEARKVKMEIIYFLFAVMETRDLSSDKRVKQKKDNQFSFLYFMFYVFAHLATNEISKSGEEHSFVSLQLTLRSL